MVFAIDHAKESECCLTIWRHVSSSGFPFSTGLSGSVELKVDRLVTQSSGADLLFYSDQGALLYKYERVCQWQSNIQSSEYANRCSILTPVAMSYPELFLSLKNADMAKVTT